MKRLEASSEVRTLKAIRRRSGWDELAATTQELEEVEAEPAQVPYDRKHATAEQARLNKLIDERAQLLADRPDAGRVAAAKARLDGFARPSERDRSMTRRPRSRSSRATSRRCSNSSPLRRRNSHTMRRTSARSRPEDRHALSRRRKPYGDEYGEILNGYRRRIAASEKRLPTLQAECQRLQKQLDEARETHGAARRAADTLKQSTEHQTLPQRRA